MSNSDKETINKIVAIYEQMSELDKLWLMRVVDDRARIAVSAQECES